MPTAFVRSSSSASAASAASSTTRCAVAITSRSPPPRRNHSGLSQLARTRAALFADGFVDHVNERERVAEPKAPRSQFVLQLGVPLVKLDGAIAPLSLGTGRVSSTDGDPVLAELVATLDEAAAASRAVVDAYRAKSRPSSLAIKRTLSVDQVPALIDHCFYRQPPSWTAVSDRYPVVPMTMTIGMMIDAARELRPDLVPIAVEEIRALRWLAVSPPIEISLLVNARRGLPLAGSTPEGECGLIDVETPGLRARDPCGSRRHIQRHRHRACHRTPRTRARRRIPRPKCTPIAGCSTARSIKASSRSARLETTASMGRSTRCRHPARCSIARAS